MSASRKRSTMHLDGLGTTWAYYILPLPAYTTRTKRTFRPLAPQGSPAPSCRQGQTCQRKRVNSTPQLGRARLLEVAG